MKDFIFSCGAVFKSQPDCACSLILERDIDVSRAERAKIRAEKMIEAAQAQEDVDQLRRATVALHRAINRINVSKHG